MIAALQRDEMLFCRASGRVVVMRDETQRGIDGIRTAEREVHVRQRRGCEFDEFRGEFDRMAATRSPPLAPGIGNSTALIAAECQFFLDNVVT